MFATVKRLLSKLFRRSGKRRQRDLADIYEELKRDTDRFVEETIASYRAHIRDEEGLRN